MSDQKVPLGEKLNQVLEEKLGPVANVIASQKHILAVRNGVIASIPLTIVGGICLILAFPPIDPKTATGTDFFTQFLLGWHHWSQANFTEIMTPFAMTMGIMALFVAMAVGYNLSMSYKLNPLSGAIMAATTYLLVSAPSQSAVFLSKVKDGMDAKAIAKMGTGALPTNFMDAKGIFTAIIIGLLVVEVMRFMRDKKITIKMPEGVPPSVVASFEALLPMIVNVFLFYMASLFIQSNFHMILPEAIMKLLAPIVSAVDSAPGVFFIAVFAQLLWFMGLHGAAIVGGVAQPFWDANLLANATEKIAGAPLTHIFTGPFWSYFVVLGGSGATLAFVILMLLSKSEQLKTIGKISWVPALFNINEPVIFGVPLVFNPVMAIPFIFTGAINGVIAFFVVKTGLISPAFVNAPWTTTAPIGAFLSTLDWRAGVLVLLLLALDIVIYYPFFKVFEKQLLQQEGQTDKNASSTNNISA